MRNSNIKIDSVIRKTIIVINGKECFVNEEDLTEHVIDYHTLNDLCLIYNEDILHFLGH